MAIYLNTNITSLMAQNNLNNSQSQMATAIQQLSSGLQINSAKDNAAGYAIATVMGSQLGSYAQATRNANDAISLSQTASGAMQSIVNNLQTMQSLAVQSANATYGSSNRASMNAEFQQLASEINRVALSTQFNGVNLLNGTFTAQTFQIGANNSANDQISLSGIASMQTNALGGVGTGTLTTFTSNATTHALAAGDLTLNGFQVGASTAGAANGQSADSAYAITNAINAVTAQTGVTATANATTLTGTAPTVGATTVTGMTINGVTIATVTGTAGQNAAGAGANLASAINAATAQTGVTATANATSGVLTLTAADGRDIVVGGTPTGSGLSAGTTTGTVSLSSTNTNGIVVGGNNFAYAGITTGGPVGVTSTGVNTVANSDILSQASAQAAITTLQGALNTVLNAQGLLGAIQNRLTSVVSNLQTATQNLTSAQSQIQSTDFAATTATLTRTQILQQAGTAMLAQANAMPNAVLTLLK